MAWVLESSASKYGDRLVLLSIANHCDRFGREAWPLQKTIALEAGVTPREVVRAIQALEALGELKVIKGAGKIGRHEYTLPLMSPAAQGDNLSLGKNYKVTNTTVPGDIRSLANKEEPSLTVPLSNDPPSSDRDGGKSNKKPSNTKPKTDPRYTEFIAAVKAGYDRRGWAFAWNARDGKQLLELLKYKPVFSVTEFRLCLKHYFDSEGVVPGAMPYTYLMKLPQYWAGPLNRFGKMLDSTPGEVRI